MRAFILLLLPVLVFAADSKPPPTAAVTKMLDDVFRSESSIGKMELISKTETQNRHLKMRIWTKGRNKALIIIDEPAKETGTVTLKVDQNLWNYLPKISRTIRVPPSMMLSPWMGTDFTNDDLVKDTSYENDFDTKPGTRSHDPEGWLFVLSVRPGIVGRWEKIEVVVTDDGSLPLFARYYDRKGRLARTMKFEDVKKFGQRRMPTRLILDSVDQPGHQTEIHYLDMTFDTVIPEGRFSLSELEKK